MRARDLAAERAPITARLRRPVQGYLTFPARRAVERPGRIFMPNGPWYHNPNDSGGRGGASNRAGLRLRRTLGPGVGLAVAGLEPLDRDMRVDLGRRRGGMAEDLLHAAQVGAALEQVGS